MHILAKCFQIAHQFMHGEKIQNLIIQYERRMGRTYTWELDKLSNSKTERYAHG